MSIGDHDHRDDNDLQARVSPETAVEAPAAKLVVSNAAAAERAAAKRKAEAAALEMSRPLELTGDLPPAIGGEDDDAAAGAVGAADADDDDVAQVANDRTALLAGPPPPVATRQGEGESWLGLGYVQGAVLHDGGSWRGASVVTRNATLPRGPRAWLSRR